MTSDRIDYIDDTSELAKTMQKMTKDWCKVDNVTDFSDLCYEIAKQYLRGNVQKIFGIFKLSLIYLANHWAKEFLQISQNETLAPGVVVKLWKDKYTKYAASFIIAEVSAAIIVLQTSLCVLDENKATIKTHWNKICCSTWSTMIQQYVMRTLTKYRDRYNTNHRP
eukprot:UN06836